MAYSFSEVWAAVPGAERSARAKAACGLFVLSATSPEAAVSVGQLRALLRLKLRRRCPSNVADVLRKGAPVIEPQASRTRSLLWWVTPTGVEYLEKLSKLDLRKALSQLPSYGIPSLHSRIRDAAQALVRDHHYSEAVGRAAKELNLLVRQRTGRDSDDGVRMMMQVFSPDPNAQTRLVIGSVGQAWERDRQEGFRFLMAGLQQGIGNVDKHGHLSVPTYEAAVELLALISFLARGVDSAVPTS